MNGNTIHITMSIQLYKLYNSIVFFYIYYSSGLTRTLWGRNTLPH